MAGDQRTLYQIAAIKSCRSKNRRPKAVDQWPSIKEPSIKEPSIKELPTDPET